ncbi:MAG: hypothetical protein ABI183_05580 [Polyangiaceae bacterium]
MAPAASAVTSAVSSKGERPVRWLPTLVFCALVTALGARFTAVSEVPAGKPFSYVPPATFKPISIPANLNADNSVNRIWVEPTAMSKLDPRISLSHAPQEAQIDDMSLGGIAQGMPALYEKSNGTWTEERHVAHLRPDGARVGLIVGDLRTTDELHLKTMQLIFPDDTGTSIVTASFDRVSSQRLVPEIEKSLDTADGVKKLGKKPKDNMYYAYFIGALIFAILAQLAFSRLRRSKS